LQQSSESRQKVGYPSALKPPEGVTRNFVRTVRTFLTLISIKIYPYTAIQVHAEKIENLFENFSVSKIY